jgi:hypothetical protein
MYTLRRILKFLERHFSVLHARRKYYFGGQNYKKMHIFRKILKFFWGGGGHLPPQVHQVGLPLKRGVQR